ncbi:zinc knuckle [Ostertagia ostertagi]
MVFPEKNPRKDPPSSTRGWSRRASVRGRSNTTTHSSSRPPPQSTPAQPSRGSSRPPVRSEQPRPPPSSSPFVEPQVRTSWADQMASEGSKTVSKTKKKDGQGAEAEVSTATSTSGVENKKSQGVQEVQEVEEEMDTSEVSKENPPLVHNVDPGDWAPTTMAPTQPTFTVPGTSWETAIAAGKNIQRDREEKDEALKRRKERMEAVVTFLEEYMDRRDRQREREGRAEPPLRVNPAPSTLQRRPIVTPHSTFQVEPYTVEELTARQFRTVFDYITTNNVLRDRIRNITVPDRETTPARPSDFELVSRIVHLLQTLLEIVQHTTQSFHNLAVILVRRQPLEIRYTHLMGWIHELTHSTTAMTVNRDQLQELILPRLLQWSHDQDYFRATLQLFGITEDTLREILMHSSAVHAHATRMIRVLEAHQMVHIFNRRRVRVTSEDEEYRLNSAVSMPPPWPEEPESYIQSLRWWRDNYSHALMIRTTEEYLQISRIDRILQEQAQGLQQRPAPQVPQRPLTQITVPKLPPPTAWPTSDPLVPPEAGHPSTSAAGRREESQALGKRKRGDDSSAPETRPPPVKTRRTPPRRSPSRSSDRRPVSRGPPAPSRSRSRFPTRAAPSESHGKVEPCAFCHGTGHYSSDCDKYPYVSSRAHLAESFGLCCNCLKPHYGICIRKDPCSVCQQEGHHRAFCNRNHFSVFDIDDPPERFFDDLRFRTYREPPPGAATRRPYQCSYRERSRTEEQERSGQSDRQPPPPERERSPEPSTSGAYRDMGFSPANSDESW